jgi:hypothetical protein
MEAQMTLEQARELAAKRASEGQAISICKLNPYQPNNVVLRQWDERDEGRWYFVEKVEVRPCE